MNSTLRPLAGLILLLALPAADAATYCVGTAAELQQALNAAAASTGDDEIRIRRGTYAQAQTFLYTTTVSGWLYVNGGWIEDGGTPCARRSNVAGDTVLDGEGLRQVFKLFYNPAVTPVSAPRFLLSNLTVRNGFGEGFVRGGGLSMFSNGENYAEFWLDNVIVAGNSGYFGGGADFYLKKGLLRIANSLFADNEAPTSAYGHLAITVLAGESPYAAVLINSTFAGGTCAGQANRGCGIGAGLGEGARMDVVNSVFADNAQSDMSIEGFAHIGFGAGTAYYDHSLVPVTTGTIAPSVTGALDGDPRFVDAAAGDYRLADDSPLLDRARGAIPVYPLAFHDLDGRRRLRFGALDPGAYENQTWDTVFAHGFDPAGD
ncbi:hypothetical protein [Dokdonella koreensis]|uniref:Uncharacterized protein n=1 Tax=Dokdonella koreensis DS-123 TaxID=1300342 RepID=A0A160DSS6_9GAMM|nr:hypothetical protein [Dokdonella koreensis]ANB17345.1 Hypothetical protein I596_1315 [Dokdonella koreensis DS-123]